MPKKVTIYGERCSGTNYLEELLKSNFDIEVVWDYGWKHFFGFHDLKNSDDVLFLGIIRNLHDWINSLCRDPHHLSSHLNINTQAFLNDTFYSVHHDLTKESMEKKKRFANFYFVHDVTKESMENENMYANFYSNKKDDEIMTDRNIETKERYKNIFELRLVKNRFLVDKMPHLVKNYLLLTYDDLTNNFVDMMCKLRDCGLTVKPNIEFPLNVTYYKDQKDKTFVKKVNKIPIATINQLISTNKELLFYETLLFKMSEI
jgi:hypothetical protein